MKRELVRFNIALLLSLYHKPVEFHLNMRYVRPCYSTISCSQASINGIGKPGWLASQHYLATAANGWARSRRRVSQSWLPGGHLPPGLAAQQVWHPPQPPWRRGEAAVQTPERSGRAHHQSERASWLGRGVPGKGLQTTAPETKPRNGQAGVHCWRRDPLQPEDPFPGWMLFLLSDCSGG